VGAAVLSCFIPGSGEFLVGNARRGAIHLAFLIALIAMYWPLRLPRHYWALVLLVYWMFALWVVSAITALRTKRSPYLRASWWWLVLVLPILYGGANLAGWSLVRVSGLRPFQVPSNSMAPTIKERERLVADMRAFRNSPPKVGDPVVFRHNGILLVKRVVAVSGDVVAGDASGFTVNGKKPDEPYAYYERSEPMDSEPFEPTKLAPGELFLVGDNRENSYDSRISGFGSVHVSDVLGRPLYLYLTKPAERNGKPIR
jgi:signal peptidase I